MTDTTDQQAVTVALQTAFYLLDTLAGEGLSQTCPDGRTIEADETVQALCSASYMEPTDDWHSDLADRLASVSSASAEPEALIENAAKALYLAYAQHPEARWDCVDPRMQEGVWRAHIRAVQNGTIRVAPEPVPATNQAGEVDAVATAKARLSIAAVKARNLGAERGAVEVIADDVAVLIAAHSDLDRQFSALATQPATSQEGEERATIVSYIRRQSDRGADIGNEKPKGSTARAAFGGGSLALKRVADNIEAGEHVINDNAATPTPPTLSEACSDCGGSGEYFGHTDDCDSDNCALAGDMDDCNGRVLSCHCQLGMSRQEAALAEESAFIELLEREIKASPTGVSFDWVRSVDGEPSGFRFMRRHFIGEPKKHLRAALAQVKAS